MTGKCEVCHERLKMTTHHRFWPKSDIKTWYPTLFAKLRTIKHKVCDHCHHQYHDHAYKHCVYNPHRKCEGCEYVPICSFNVLGVGDVRPT